jgi:FkbM family methyltransferase
MIMFKSLYRLLLGKTVKRLRRRDEPTIIIIGAFGPEIPLYYHDKVPEARIFVLEACEKTYKALRRGVKKTEQIHTDLLAASDKTGFEYFQQIGSNISNSFYHDAIARKEGKVKRVEVPSTSLDDYCMDKAITHIDLLKVNCVGGEYKIFANDSSFMDDTDMLMVEVHAIEPFDTPEFVKKRAAMYKRLEAHGLELKIGIREAQGVKFYSQLWIRK